MAVFNYTIKSSGGDYTSLSAFEAALPAVGSDTYIATYDEAMTDTTAVTFTGIGGSIVVEVTVAEAYRCEGAVSGSHAELVVSGAGAARTIWNQHPTLTIRHLRIVRDGAGGGSYTLVDSAASGSPLYDSCTFIRRAAAATGGELMVCNAAGGPEFRNCFFVASGFNNGGLNVFNNVAGTPKFYNCTIFVADGTVAHINSSGGTCVTDCRNCLIIKAAGATAGNCYNGAAARWSVSCTKNAATDASATTPSADGYNSVSATSIKVPTVGSEDLHFANSAAMVAVGAGADLSGMFTVDIDGQLRSAWYTGGDYVADNRFVTTPSGQFVLVGAQFVLA